MKSEKKNVGRKKSGRQISATARAPLPPPNGYDTWLDYAVNTLSSSTRQLYLDYLWGNQPQWPENVQRDDFDAALAAELAALRAVKGKPPMKIRTPDIFTLTVFQILRAARWTDGATADVVTASFQRAIESVYGSVALGGEMKVIGTPKTGRTKIGSGIAAFDALSRFSGPALVDRIGAGVNARDFARLAAAFDISAADLAGNLGLSARAIRGRSRLSGDETERAYRAYRVLVRAREVLENEVNASKWMRSPLGALAGRTPCSLLVRDVGAQEVLNVLGRLEHSVIA